MTDATLYVLMAVGIGGLLSCLAGLAALHEAWRRSR